MARTGDPCPRSQVRSTGGTPCVRPTTPPVQEQDHDFSAMNRMIPWDSPAVIGIKRRGALEFSPEVAGLSLNQALQKAIELRVLSNAGICIWVTWGDSERMIQGRLLLQLAFDPERPPLSSEDEPAP